MYSEQILLCSWLAAAIVYIWLLRGARIKRLFRVPIYTILLGADIGGHRQGYKIRKRGVQGCPDAVFFDPFKWQLIVGEYKSRRFAGRVNAREKYQVTLYSGLARNICCWRTTAILAYGCGRTVKIPYNNMLFQSLLKLKQEVQTAQQTWVPGDRRPVHMR